MDIENKPGDVINNEQWHQFELPLGDERPYIKYSRQGNTFLLMHTEVPPALEGHGIAKNLVEQTLEWLDKNNFRMKVYCPYISSYIKRHPEWKKLEDPTIE